MESGAQHAQLMKDGEVDMTTGWNGRFDVAIADGAKATYTYNQGLLDYDCFGIPKGAPNKDLAMKFIAEMSKAEYQAEHAEVHHLRADQQEGLRDSARSTTRVARNLPSHPENASKLQLAVDQEWYAKWEKVASSVRRHIRSMLTE